MNTNSTFKTGLSAFVLSAALASTGALAADSDQDSDMLNMKTDANVENRSADKSSAFNNARDETNRRGAAYERPEAQEQEYQTSERQNSNSERQNSNNAEQILHFEFDSTTLTEQSQRDLAAIKDRLSENDADAEVELVGYTDTSGPEAYNKHLSEERAKAIKSELEGLNVKVVEVEAMGEQNPIANNDSREGRAENRRVEVSISD